VRWVDDSVRIRKRIIKMKLLMGALLILAVLAVFGTAVLTFAEILQEMNWSVNNWLTSMNPNW